VRKAGLPCWRAGTRADACAAAWCLGEPGRLILGKLRISCCCRGTRIVRPFAAFAYEHTRYSGGFEGHVRGNIIGLNGFPLLRSRIRRN
jgi:hypothetical protein